MATQPNARGRWPTAAQACQLLLAAALPLAAAALILPGAPEARARQAKKRPGQVPPPPRDIAQFKQPQLTTALIEASEFIRVGKARDDFKVSGNKLTAAVLDTGLRTTHVDFKDRVLAQKNFTNEGGVDDATDKDGHGTNVAGIIAANKLHIGIAPGAGLIPIKVLGKNGGTFEDIEKGLKWVLDNRAKFNITVVNMSLGDQGNYVSDEELESDAPLRATLEALRNARVAVIAAAGNGYFQFSPSSGGVAREGMGYPAILRTTVSVGAVYDSTDHNGHAYGDGGIARSTRPGALTPFTQRLHPTVSTPCRTDIFAPGAPVRSAGIETDKGESVQHGTSQASPVTAGVILLMQEYHLRETGELPTVESLELWLRNGGQTITDGDDEDDNVAHTKKQFIRLDALGALQAVQRGLTKRLWMEKKAFK